MNDYDDYYPSAIDYTLNDGRVIFEMQLLGIEGKNVVFNSDSEERRVLIQRYTNPLNKEKKDYKISVRYNETLNRGDVVKFKEKNYLTVTIPEDNDLYKRADIEYCNVSLNFIDNSGSIRSLPCVYIVSSSSTTSDKYMEIVNGEVLFVVQNNEYTKQLKRNSNRRFILSDNECFELKNVFTSLKDGLILLNLQQSEINFETDKLIEYNDSEIWIADYTEASIFLISIDQSNSDILINESLQLSAQITKDGEIFTENIVWSSSDELKATISEDGIVTTITEGEVSITASMENNLEVISSITLNITSVIEDNFEIQFNPNIDYVRLGESQNFNTLLLNNGEIQSDAFVYSIIGGNSKTSNYVFKIVDDNNFEISCVDYDNSDTNIIVRCVSGSNVVDKTIILKYFYD